MPSSPHTWFLDRYWRTNSAPFVEVEPTLASVDPTAWMRQAPEYRAAILEQYKVYVEMADRTSARRALANTFFLTLNTAVFTLFGVLWEHRPIGSSGWLGFPLIALVAQCFAWYLLLRSYRQLNTAKYTVIGAIESHLPISPYYRAEWAALGEGKDSRRYLPLTHVEQWIPLVFGATYIAAFVAALLA